MRQQRAPVVERVIHVVVRQQTEHGLAFADRLRHANPVGTLPVRHDVEDRYAHDDSKARQRAADPLDDLRQKQHPVVERSAVGARPVFCAEQLVAQIAMTRFHVDELEAAVVCERRGRDVVVHQVLELGVGQHADASGNRRSRSG